MDKAEGGHFDIKLVIDSLDKKTWISQPLTNEAGQIFTKIGQTAYDWLHDIAQNNNLEYLDAVILGLFYSAIDELIVAFHLSQHSYAPQSFSHIRTVQEILDKKE